MSYDISLPNMNLKTANDLTELQAYLFKMVGELNWALNSLENPSGNAQNVVTVDTSGNAINDEVVNAQATFNSIKSLIIKSADIITAYEEQITNHFNGMYVAESSFGEYREETKADIEENSKGVKANYSNIQTVSSRVDGIDNAMIEVNAYINKGLLYYDDNGNPIYGLEVGQRNEIEGVETFNKYARFTSDRLSFYDNNDTEVAYISDRKLYITQAQITGEITLGNYKCDLTDGIAFKWLD